MRITFSAFSDELELMAGECLRDARRAANSGSKADFRLLYGAWAAIYGMQQLPGKDRLTGIVLAYANDMIDADLENGIIKGDSDAR